MTELTLFSSSQPLEKSLELAKVILDSKLAPADLKSPEAILVACTFGAELGFTPIQSMNLINVISGKPTLGSAALQAICLKAGGEVVTKELTPFTCTVEISRPGKTTQSFTFSKADADAQGLSAKSNWVKMPKAMLYARAVSEGVRKMFADIIAGVYSTEEMQDSVNEDYSRPAPKAKAPPVEKASLPEPKAIEIDAVEVSSAPVDYEAYRKVALEVVGKDIQNTTLDSLIQNEKLDTLEKFRQFLVEKKQAKQKQE